MISDVFYTNDNLFCWLQSEFISLSTSFLGPVACSFSFPPLCETDSCVFKAWSKHTCAYVTGAVCGVTSVFRLQPYLKGKWAPVVSTAAW